MRPTNETEKMIKQKIGLCQGKIFREGEKINEF